MKRIILDTNFLLIPGQFKVDIFEEIRRISNFMYQLCIIDKSLEELEKIITTGNTKDKTAARIALKLIKLKKIAKIKTTGNKNVDDLIMDLASKDGIVATQDKELKQKLRKRSIPIIILKQKKYLSMA